MKKIVLILIFVSFIFTGCVSNVESESGSESTVIEELKNEIIALKQDQNSLLEEITSLDEKVSNLETSLNEKEEDIRILKLEMDSFYHVNDGQEHYFESKIDEGIRLYGYGEVQEVMVLVENFNYDTNEITVQNKHSEIIKYKVSDECKVLVAGQYYTIFQNLDEGKDFLDSVTQDEGNKVILVFKNDVVEQIKMYGHGEWLE